MRTELHKVFDTRADADAACDRLNRHRPEWGYTRWYLASGPGGKWWTDEGEWSVVRTRHVIAEDLDQDARAYEQEFRAHVERSAMQHDYWRDSEGIRIEEISLTGSYRHTTLVKVFRPVTSRKTPFGQPTAGCRFGIRWPIWPAESHSPAEEARAHDTYFQEFLGTDPRAYRRLRGVDPCDPHRINWLD